MKRLKVPPVDKLVAPLSSPRVLQSEGKWDQKTNLTREKILTVLKTSIEPSSQALKVAALASVMTRTVISWANSLAMSFQAKMALVLTWPYHTA